jgi:hypothetical protein
MLICRVRTLCTDAVTTVVTSVRGHIVVKEENICIILYEFFYKKRKQNLKFYSAKMRTEIRADDLFDILDMFGLIMGLFLCKDTIQVSLMYVKNFF